MAAVKKGGTEFDDFGYAEYPRAKPVEPERWRIDPILSVQAIYHGIHICDTADEKPTLESVVWALLEEAARTERAITPPKPAGYFSAYPEVYRYYSEEYAAAVGKSADELAAERQKAPRATAAEMQRYEAVTPWLAYVRGRNKAQSKRIIWQLAQGRSPESLAKSEGYGTGRGVRAKRDKELRNIANRLKEELEALRRFFS